MDIVWSGSEVETNENGQDSDSLAEGKIPDDKTNKRHFRRWIAQSGIPRREIEVLFKILDKYHGVKFPKNFMSLNDKILKGMNYKSSEIGQFSLNDQSSNQRLNESPQKRRSIQNENKESDSESDYWLMERITETPTKRRSITNTEIISDLDIFPITLANHERVLKRLKLDDSLKDSVKMKFLQDKTSITSIKDREIYFRKHFADDFTELYRYNFKGKKSFNDEEIFSILFSVWQSNTFGCAEWERFLKIYNRKRSVRECTNRQRKKNKQ